MGYGDFKALAALGAWLGLHVLPWVLLFACVAAMMVGGWRICRRHLKRDQPQPFGPYLAAAGIFVLFTVRHFDGFIGFYG
jgi:leader peptidase (prepilin peptidase)/N-methyltransferase